MNGQTKGHSINSHIVLLVGIALLVIPLIVAIFARETYGDVQHFLRIIAALGAGLTASLIPGFLKIRFPGVEALGGIAAFALVLMYDPLWKLDTALGSLGPDKQTKVQTHRAAMPTSDLTAASQGQESFDVRVNSCVAEKVAAYEQPKIKTVSGGARAPSPGLGGGTKRASTQICLSVGADQKLIEANTKNLTCHGGRCKVTQPTIDGQRVCVVAEAWSESKSFGGGGSGQYELMATYRDIATEKVTSGFLAECRNIQTREAAALQDRHAASDETSAG